jgi:hypothetical protein
VVFNTQFPQCRAGSTPVRVFFHVDYKPNATESRKVGKDDMSGLDKQLELMHTRIQDISREIEHARKQEIAMKEAGGTFGICSPSTCVH